MSLTDIDVSETDITAMAGPPPQVLEGMERFFTTLNGYMALQALAIAHRTGVLTALLQGPGTAAQIAERSSTHERPTCELLAALTAAGYLQHDGGRFEMAPGQAALFEGGVLPFDPTVLLDVQDVMMRVLPALDQSVRDGSGVPYAAYQPEFSAAQDAMNAPLYQQFLVEDWVPSVDGLTQRLVAGLDAVDIGCGGGRAVCLLAAAFPASRFVGYDVDDQALALAADRAAEEGLTNVRFEHRDVAELGLDAEIDLALAVDAIHDQARPAQVAAGIRRALRPDGVFVMVEPTASGDLDTDIAHPMAVTGYVMSLSHCVQVSLAEGGPGLGGMWGMAGAVALLEESGFGQVSHHDSPCDYTVHAARV